MKRWYEQGLRFECTRCGNCCTGTPGYVWVDEGDEERIAAHLGIERSEFKRRYTRLAGTRLSLTERPGGECIFLTAERTCEINEAKPRQCITFPFWPRLIADPRNWDTAALECPGMGQGPRYEADEIDVLLDFSHPREVLCKVVQKPRLALRKLYEQVDADVAGRPGLRCELSGRCCRFKQAGHELYLTRLEYEEMAERGGGGREADPERCPWLTAEGLCGNREGRALGCRSYHCSDEAQAAEVTERWHAEIRGLHEKHGVEYVYRSLTAHMNSD